MLKSGNELFRKKPFLAILNKEKKRKEKLHKLSYEIEISKYGKSQSLI